MAKAKRRQLSADEQQILEHLQVRLLTSPKDKARCDELILEHHYLHEATLVGEQFAVAGFAGVSLSQSDQPLYEADAGTTVPRLAGALGASLGAGRIVCRSSALPGHRLQSQWLVASGQNGWMETRCR